MAGLTKLIAMLLLSGTAVSPSVDECARKMKATWDDVPPFQADYHSLIWHVDGDARTLDWDALGRLQPPQSRNEANHGWFSVYPTWFSYRYIREGTVFDISEYPTEVRVNGSRCFKYNRFIGTVYEQIPRDEEMRQGWIAHYMLVTWQLDFVRRLNPGPKLSRYLLPTALGQKGYRFAGEADIDGLKCVHLELPGQDDLWLAPSRSWNCVRRQFKLHEGPDGQQLWSISRQWDFALVRGRYMPKRVVAVQQFTKHRMAIHRLEVSEYQEIPDEPPVPPRVSGSIWMTADFGNGSRHVEFVPGESRNTLDELLARLRKRIAQPSDKRWSPAIFLTFVCGCGVACVSAIVRKTLL
jgi:hypothetical protein